MTSGAPGNAPSPHGFTRLAVLLLGAGLALSACGKGGSDTTLPGAAGKTQITKTTSAASIGGGDVSVPPGAEALASVLASGTDDAKSPTCKYFTKQEISDALGAKVGDGHDAALGSGCQWADDTQDNVSVLIQVVTPDYWEEPSLGDGYQELKGIGVKAFVIPELGGFHAAALVSDKAINVEMSGGKASKDAAVAFLKETIKRAG